MRPGGAVAALEGLRGHAAFLVFLVHAFGLLAARLYGIEAEGHDVWLEPDIDRVLLVLLARSHYGVDLFFVLSGLLMADLALRRWPGAGAFLRRRWLRIYPAYLASTVLVAVVSWAWLGRSYGPAELAANLALLQGFFLLGLPAVNPVSWSLSYEAVFYLSVPGLALLWRRRGAPRPATLLAIFGAIVAAAAAVPAAKAIYLAYFALFLPGIAIGLLSPGERDALAGKVPTGAVLLSWVAFSVAMKLGVLTNLMPAYYLASGIACGALVLKAGASEGWLARVLSGAAPCWLGRYSYSFFLIHYVALHLWGAWLAALMTTQHRLAYAAIYLVGGFALSLAAARLLWEFAEAFYFRTRRSAP